LLYSGLGGTIGYWLSTGAAVLTTHLMDQLAEAFMCKKEFFVYVILTLSLYFLPFLSYDALRICFLTHLVQLAKKCFLYFCSCSRTSYGHAVASQEVAFFSWLPHFSVSSPLS
jgi:hypothetical protein